MPRRCYLDWGNTRVKAWICHDGQVEREFSFLHALQPLRLLEVLPDDFRSDVDSVSVSSVLDDASNEHMAALIRQVWKVEPQFAVSTAKRLTVSNGYDVPGMLGVDRWLNLLAVSDAQPVCVVSCGTALTIDLLREDQHLGGYILPGLKMQIDALVQGTRRVRPDIAEQISLLPGRSTAEAVYNGVMLGAVSAITQAVEILAELSAIDQPALVLTGGDAEKLSVYLQKPHAMIPSLILKGLQRYFSHEVG